MTKLTDLELENLFNELIENASHLLGAAISLLDTKEKHISLALAELALEEVGKSFTCLAYYSISSTSGASVSWNIFWKEWKDHNLKAHRAFLYEFFSTIRSELENDPGYSLSKRKSIPLEKEVSLYIDFDKENRKVITPSIEIDNTEIYFRVSSVVGLLNASMLVKDLIEGKSKEYKKAVSYYAFIIMTSPISQEEAVSLLVGFKDGFTNHEGAFDDILKMFTHRVQEAETQ